MAKKIIEMNYDSFSTYLRAMRIALGKTQEWVSNRVKAQVITAAYISMYERGVLDPCDAVKEEIRKAFENEFRNQQLVFGAWKAEYIQLRYLVEVMDICKSNFVEQKKAYDKLKDWIEKHDKLSSWELKIFDPAFGEMELYKEEKT